MSTAISSRHRTMTRRRCGSYRQGSSAELSRRRDNLHTQKTGAVSNQVLDHLWWHAPEVAAFAAVMEYPYVEVLDISPFVLRGSSGRVTQIRISPILGYPPIDGLLWNANLGLNLCFAQAV